MWIFLVLTQDLRIQPGFYDIGTILLTFSKSLAAPLRVYDAIGEVVGAAFQLTTLRKFGANGKVKLRCGASQTISVRGNLLSPCDYFRASEAPSSDSLSPSAGSSQCFIVTSGLSGPPVLSRRLRPFRNQEPPLRLPSFHPWGSLHQQPMHFKRLQDRSLWPRAW